MGPSAGTRPWVIASEHSMSALCLCCPSQWLTLGTSVDASRPGRIDGAMEPSQEGAGQANGEHRSVESSCGGRVHPGAGGLSCWLRDLDGLSLGFNHEAEHRCSTSTGVTPRRRRRFGYARTCRRAGGAEQCASTHRGPYELVRRWGYTTADRAPSGYRPMVRGHRRCPGDHRPQCLPTHQRADH